MTDSHVALPGSRRAAPSGAHRLRDVDPQSVIEVTLTLAGKALPPLDKLAPTALDLATLDRRHGVRQPGLRKVESALRGYGLSIQASLHGGRSLRVSGSISAMREAFQPNLAMYAVPGQGEVRAREGSLMIPAELQGLVTGVHGLDQRRMAGRAATGRSTRARAGQAAAPKTAAAFTPDDLARHYAFPDGAAAGQSVHVVEFGAPAGGSHFMAPAYFPDDVAAFCAGHGRPLPTISICPVGTTPLSKEQYNAYMRLIPRVARDTLQSHTDETMMDIEVLAAQCGGAAISVYFAGWDQKGWIDVLDEMTSTPVPPVAISISYGMAEEAPDWSHGAMAAINERLQFAAMRGITVCCSAGDDGTFCGQEGSRCHVEFPASSPHVLSVGGTMLEPSQEGPATEVVWWESPGYRAARRGGATGGGVSALNPKPPWQRETVASLNPGGHVGRIVPDVAALAGPPEYQLIVDGRTETMGGTSASAPLWAALIACINAQLPEDRRQRFLPRLLYEPAIAKTFRSIVSGNNAAHPMPGRGYAAGPGFDAVSGLGVPDGCQLLAALSRR